MTTNQEASDLTATYLATYNRAMEKLGRLRDLVMELPSPGMESCDWGAVGDLVSFERRLEKLITWMADAPSQ